MKLSVLLTFYNQEEYVDAALKSILCQQIEYDYEILVGDDGSSDGTQEKVMEYIQQYPDKIKLHIMKRDKDRDYNAGYRASKNRLNLLKHVEGEYFIFLDGDDAFCDEEKLQKQISILDDPRNRDCIACAHNVYKENTKSKRKELVNSRFLKEQKMDLETYWSSYYFHPDSIMCRSNIISKLPYEIIRYFFNDNMITFWMLQYGKIYYLPDVMAVYYQTGKGIWTGQSEIIRAIRTLMFVEASEKINPDLQKLTIVREFFALSNLYHKRRDIKLSELEFYYKLARHTGLRKSLRWIGYENASIMKKAYCNLEYLGWYVISRHYT